MITQVKWNEVKPKFEDVEGRYLVIKLGLSGVYQIPVVTRTIYDSILMQDKYSVYAILSDEPVYCEWLDSRNGLYEPSCTKGFRFTGDAHLCYPYCPKCGLPIKVIDELKPLPLMGIEPKIEYSEGSDGHLWTYQWRMNETIINSNSFYSKREAIESWNSLVKKLTGEK
jgi:hypothetical protein